MSIKNLRKKNIFIGTLKDTDEKSRIRSQILIRWSKVQIRGSGSVGTKISWIRTLLERTVHYLSSCILWKVMLTCGIWCSSTAQSPGRYSCWLCVITLVSWDILLKARVQFLSQHDFFPGPVTNSKRVIRKSLLHFKIAMKKLSCHGLMRPS
jgi:hypothetical protein